MSTTPKPDFTHRTPDLVEWMDEPCSYDDFRACLRSLAQVNRVTLSHRPTLNWLRQFPAPREHALHIVDVGSGGGDMLRRIERWARRRRLPVKLTGIDLNPYAARAARERTQPSSKIEWITGDAFSFQPSQPVDVVISSLFTHHLPDDQIVRFLRWMESTARLGWFINDLHRQPMPYYGFKLLANVARWHRFVRHDGPVSLLRAFRRDDWQRLLHAANLAPYATVEEVRPARLCVSRVRR